MPRRRIQWTNALDLWDDGDRCVGCGRLPRGMRAWPSHTTHGEPQCPRCAAIEAQGPVVDEEPREWDEVDDALYDLEMEERRANRDRRNRYL